ncbi:hypothetical protein UNDKW_3234 [Undibacterium sp. KW1]|uniref:DUF4347 domain-containing protein n=1 Tax=Undibacterium sp. KW1 TaxID=2058624 RepID=UPI001331D140|nr:DUF4347 domain-containing protein [Undibacterium sp. KW1]BBB61507.1 hypothetical protein UNDKW_3234 [Undibacterium sp. KW1]
MNLLNQTAATDIQSVHEDALANSTVAHLMATLSTPAPSLSLGTAANPSAGQQILIIDGRVPDQATLINAAKEGVKVIVLDTEHDGVQQIADALKDVHNASSISIISHGDDGVLLLGNSPLHNGNVANYTEQLKAISASLQTGGEIRLYGCDIGKDSVGQDFIQSIAQVTGATVEASTDATGTASRGATGTWKYRLAPCIRIVLWIPASLATTIIYW